MIRHYRLAAIAALMLAAWPAAFAQEAPQEEGKGTAPAGSTPAEPDTGAAQAADVESVGAAASDGAPRGFATRIPAAQDVAYPGTLTLQVDLTDTERRLFKVRESIPVRPGPLTLLYPEWLPGHHAPRGPIDGLAGLTVRAGTRQLEWIRDPVNVYAFHLQVPAGVSRLDLEFEFASALVHEQGRTVVTPDLLGLQWNMVVLYPAGYFVSRVPVSAAIALPEGWEFAAALEVENRQGAAVHFRTVSLEELVDSPLFAGRYFRSFDLDPGARVPVRLNVFADSPEILEAGPSQIAAHRRLVHESYALFGPPHFDRYDFLLALSDHFGEIGLEHHRSSENRRAPTYFLDWERGAAGRDLLPHEISHAWNGKYRRPVGLLTADFNVPMRNSLLWVYEGLTNYYGTVLAARSGLWSEEFTRQSWASLAANMDQNRAGRAWRDLEDTTEQPVITARRPLSWLSWQRTEDYYTEGELLWLDIDTRIRELTREKRSLDDFVRAFFGGTPGPGPVSYSLQDVIDGLRGVASYDWAKYLEERLHGHGPGAPLDGLTRGGWKLIYIDAESEYLKSLEEQRRVVDFTYSLGFAVSALTYQLTEVRWGGPAYAAGLTMGTTVLAVNGREYRPDRLKLALNAARLNHQPIELLVRTLDRYRTVRIPYTDGIRYPQLLRIEKSQDRLASILHPRG